MGLSWTESGVSFKSPLRVVVQDGRSGTPLPDEGSVMVGRHPPASGSGVPDLLDYSTRSSDVTCSSSASAILQNPVERT
jgi:hypothetical protein